VQTQISNWQVADRYGDTIARAGTALPVCQKTLIRALILCRDMGRKMGSARAENLSP